MKNFSQPGENLTLKAPYAVLAGGGFLCGSLFAVAVNDIASGALGAACVEGVFFLLKTNPQTWTQGDKIYFDPVNKLADNDPSKGFPLIGAAAADAGNTDASGYVTLMEGPTRFAPVGVIEESSGTPVSINTAGPVTLTAAQLLAGIIVRDPNGASRSDTLPTAALLVAAVLAAVGRVAVGMVVKTKIVNGADAAEVITLLVGTGITFDANQQAVSEVIGQNTSKELRIRLTNVGAGTEAAVAYL